jgi:hypothetical protein
MRTFHFRIDLPGREPFEKSRSLEGEAEAVSYARQLLTDWPDCIAIDVLQTGALVERLRPPRP